MAKAPAAQKAQSGNNFFTKIAKLKSGPKFGILIGGAVAVIAAFYLLYYQPYNDQVAALTAEVEGLKSSVTTEQQNINKHAPLSQYVEPVADTFNYLQNYLTSENEIPRLMQIISDLGARSGARVTLFAPKPATIQTDYATIDFTMTLEGSFLNIIRFLYSISQMERIINIRSVTMAQKSMGDDFRMLLSVNCEGSTYRLLTADEAVLAKQGAAK
ncbi:MAG: type 4a pilus biogenesis protein PilO [Deltaproteobacteria bacterium]|jgi:Tfp pilus assembly protein PilO|nr:type 4a pilus biogenesis protein PilO [Deltaproteobacteria bacterium]